MDIILALQIWKLCERKYLRITYLIVLITAACVVIFEFKLHLKYIVKIQWTQLFEKKTWFQFLIVAVGVVWFIHFSLEVVCSLCPCFYLSTFHLFALLADLRTDDASCYVKSISYKNFTIDSLLISHLNHFGHMGVQRGPLLNFEVWHFPMKFFATKKLFS